MEGASSPSPARTILYDLLCAPSSPINAVELDELVRMIGRSRVDANEALRRELNDLSSILDGLECHADSAAFERVMLCTQLSFFISQLMEYTWRGDAPAPHGGTAAGRARAAAHVQSLLSIRTPRGRGSSTAAGGSRPSTAASGSSSDSTLAAVVAAAEATVEGRLFAAGVDDDTLARVAAHMREALEDEHAALSAEIEWMTARIDEAMDAAGSRGREASMDAVVAATCASVGVDVHAPIATLRDLKAVCQREWLRTEAALIHGRTGARGGLDADAGVFRTRLHASLHAAAAVAAQTEEGE